MHKNEVTTGISILILTLTWQNICQGQDISQEKYLNFSFLLILIDTYLQKKIILRLK